MTKYTQLEMDCALCLWEAMMEHRKNCEPLDKAFEANGFAEMRRIAIELSPLVDGVWMMVEQDEYAECFDWCFCPDMLHHIDWVEMKLKGDAKTIAASFA